MCCTKGRQYNAIKVNSFFIINITICLTLITIYKLWQRVLIVAGQFGSLYPLYPP